ncbi:MULTISPECIES: transposase [Streptomyces]|uniref:transposase n=1 Tax=Streptomyces TaxID=1883 RepID=UPI00374E1634
MILVYGEPRAVPAPRKYPDELRERAVREVRATGHPIAHVAKDLGIHKEALRGWMRQAEADAGERDDRLTTAELELKQLRKTVPGRGRPGDRTPSGQGPRGRVHLPDAGTAPSLLTTPARSGRSRPAGCAMSSSRR